MSLYYCYENLTAADRINQASFWTSLVSETHGLVFLSVVGLLSVPVWQLNTYVLGMKLISHHRTQQLFITTARPLSAHTRRQ
jgi:hypothetical protein